MFGGGELDQRFLMLDLLRRDERVGAAFEFFESRKIVLGLLYFGDGDFELLSLGVELQAAGFLGLVEGEIGCFDSSRRQRDFCLLTLERLGALRLRDAELLFDAGRIEDDQWLAAADGLALF